mmetsp:Transcript_17742/g.25582  ORF Transcript_17742/g.25582 Transcript_17742/m.25582 type:complete len:100 (+) Transcript_17742:524-823(+)
MMQLDFGRAELMTHHSGTVSGQSTQSRCEDLSQFNRPSPSGHRSSIGVVVHAPAGTDNRDLEPFGGRTCAEDGLREEQAWMTITWLICRIFNVIQKPAE